MTDSLTILHLSDLQFGKNHRYPDGEGSFSDLSAKLAEDLDELAEKRDLRPTAIVVTGGMSPRRACRPSTPPQNVFSIGWLRSWKSLGSAS